MKHGKPILSCLLALSVGLGISTNEVSAHDGDGSSLSNPDLARTGSSEAPFSSQRVILLGQVELEDMGGGGNVFGSDCWGWTDAASDRKFAIMGLTNACSFIEVTDPTNPVYLGKVNTHEAGQNRAWRDIKVYNDHAYIVADGGGNDQGIQIFDLTQLLTADPANPQTFPATAHYDDFGPSHNIEINVDTGYAYVIGARTLSGSRYHSGGLVIMDLSDPLNITEAGNFALDGYTHDCQAVIYAGPDADHAGKEIVLACNEDTVTIVDVTDKSNTSQISRIGYAERGYTHQGWLSEDHRFFYMNDELDEYNHANAGGDPLPTRTHIFNVEDLDNPVYQGFYEGVERTIDHNLYVKGDFIYQAHYTSGLRILRIDSSDPSNLTEYGFFDTFTPDNDVDFNGAWSCYPYFDYGDDDIIIVSDRQGGLFITQRLKEPQVTSTELNIGDEQRSAVESISLTLNGEIVFDPGAISLVQRSTATEETFEAVTINVTESFDGDQTTATIQFDSHTRNPDNALVDGNYQLTLAADLVTRDGIPMAEDFVFGDVEEDAFFSFYGDGNGDRTSDVFDLLLFRQAYRTVEGDANYDFSMDYEANGAVNILDLLQFRIRFRESIPFVFGSSRSLKGAASSGKRTITTNTKATTRNSR